MKTSRRNNDVDMQEKYDFSHGVRGKYAKEYAKGTNMAILDPEVAKVDIKDLRAARAEETTATTASLTSVRKELKI